MNSSKKVLSFTIALALAIAFLWATVFSESSAFNFLPFEIHEGFNPGGESEGTFIIIFDSIVALLILILGYVLLNKAFKR